MNYGADLYEDYEYSKKLLRTEWCRRGPPDIIGL